MALFQLHRLYGYITLN